jgi:hypothetical protein
MMLIGAVADGIDRRILGATPRVDIDAVGAIEPAGDAGAHRLFELGLRHARRLRLAGHDQARGIDHRRFEHLAGEQNDRRFDDGEEQRQERRGDKREFDRGRAILIAAQTPPSRKGSDCLHSGMRCHRLSRILI